MSTVIYFYTGTGNSLWAAKKLAAELGGADPVPMTMTGDGIVGVDADCIGLVSPVHIWGLPHRVLGFVERFRPGDSAYCFSVAVNAGQPAATLIQLERVMKEKGHTLSSGFSLCMPSNYIPWGGAPPAEKQHVLFGEADRKITVIADVIRKRIRQAPEKGPWWQNVLFSWFYRMSFPRVPGMDKSFLADAKCNGCGICGKICPARNISLEDSRPEWKHRCEQCLACIQWCPQEAIQFGKGTEKKRRYHHPDIKLADMLACIPKGHE